MKRFVEGTDRDQSTLFPATLDDYVGEDNPVRAIDAFVDGLDLAKLGFEGVAPLATGRPAYHAADTNSGKFAEPPNVDSIASWKFVSSPPPVELGFVVMSIPAVDTVGAALRCSTAPASYSRAGAAMA
jgi:hypothetical protein